MSNLGEHLGRRIKALRSDRGLSQVDLADAAGTSEEWIRKLERGARAPSLATLDAVSRALGVTVSALFAGADQQSGRYEALLMEVEGLSDAQLDWVEAAARLVRKMPS